MTARYYKTNAPAVLRAVEQLRCESKALQEAGSEFAAHWGGTALFLNSHADNRFGGVKFSPPRMEKAWTKPDRDSGIQRPRAKLSGAGLSAEDRDDFARIHEAWNAGFPKLRADKQPLLAALGTDWGSAMICGIGYFEGCDGFFYVQTSAHLAAFLEEITGGAYLAAQRATEEQSKQERTPQ